MARNIYVLSKGPRIFNVAYNSPEEALAGAASYFDVIRETKIDIEEDDFRRLESVGSTVVVSEEGETVQVKKIDLV